MALGSVTGALLSARRERPRLRILLIGSAVFAVGCGAAAVAPGAALFGVALIITGVAAQTFTTSTNSLVQLSTDANMRGRVVAILLAIALGGTPLGAPVVGWIADRFGPRWGLAVGAVSGLLALLVGIVYLVRYCGLRVSGSLRRGYRLTLNYELAVDHRHSATPVDQAPALQAE